MSENERILSKSHLPSRWVTFFEISSLNKINNSLPAKLGKSLKMLWEISWDIDKRVILWEDGVDKKAKNL